MTLIGKQRIVIGMYDGLGMDYMEASPLRGFRSMVEQGFFKRVSAVFPTVTNANNASICCGTWPKEHGITGNSYFNEVTGDADYMENADFICVPTVIQRAAERGVKSALLTCKVAEKSGSNLDLSTFAQNGRRLICRNFGAGDRGRTGDVQLGNFVSNFMFSSVAART